MIAAKFLRQFETETPGGSASAVADEEEQQEVEEVEIDGEKVKLDDLVDAYKNKKDWQKASTRRDQELAEARRSLEAVTNKIIDKIGDKDGKETAEPEIEWLEKIESLPDPVTDKESFQRELKGVFKDVSRWAKEEAARQAGDQTRRVQEEFAQKLEAKAIESRIIDSNYRVLNERLAEIAPGLSKADRAKVEQEMAGYRGERHGAYVSLADGTRVFQYSPDAVDAAIRTLNIKPPAPKKEAASKGERQEAPAKPPVNAPLNDKISYLRSLPEGDLMDEVARMGDKEKTEIMAQLRSLYSSG